MYSFFRFFSKNTIYLFIFPKTLIQLKVPQISIFMIKEKIKRGIQTEFELNKTVATQIKSKAATIENISYPLLFSYT
ncbi:hypothetical protein AWRIB418_1204 [Oenococcus oeni AWRIB418]|nr:hypothetical protein AWRIB304_1017 [Oenococcus oeni AWRIB304]EJO01196.1 hypothetical protein AWRIB418_1204 [Oenococcus oeni AWRIB418]EJO08640.1 hypothetical protein AWRIB553_470 [Oenococcus oeni AWRIB553]KZD13191.1 hypothetical protein AC229_1775 [Oenococcus oeni]